MGFVYFWHMIKVHNKRMSNLVLVCDLVVGVLLVCLNIIRIKNIPITFDEYDSWALIQRSPWDIMMHFEGSANNHMLNTFLQKIFTTLFGENLFALRADSLMAQIIFLV